MVINIEILVNNEIDFIPFRQKKTIIKNQTTPIKAVVAGLLNPKKCHVSEKRLFHKSLLI